ncbi:hypothetical protein LRS05_11510 [Flavobacterium sp. J372]|uniref:hypothetical protein n=1 Tax=Flavobacterium sp. J372 TaxID=2898436 RepID=UPI0021519C79|nr:hypothetical protein [Flavobacterium sp. J372]MCR5862728.1 hypothetical protein [Flavobacterium sp. J372]
MKSSFPILVYSIMLMCLYSCNIGTVNIETQEGVNNARDIIIERFGENKEINGLSLVTATGYVPTMESVLQTVTIEYPIQNKVYYEVYKLAEPDDVSEPDLLYKFEPRLLNKSDDTVETVRIKEIKFDEIPSYVEAAKKLIKNKHLYSSIHLSEWDFSVTKNHQVTHIFTIMCTLKKPEPLQRGSWIRFEIDEEGKLKEKKYL